MDNLKTLQTNLAIDLVKLEDSNIKEETLNKIEEVYQRIYNLISNIDQRKD